MGHSTLAPTPLSEKVDRMSSKHHTDAAPTMESDCDKDVEKRIPTLVPEEAAALRMWVVLARAHSAIEAHAAADVARHGMTLAEFAILEALYHRGQMLLGEVQRRVLVSSGGITFLVDRLVAKGLVERRNCDSDRRARYAALTPAGEALLSEIFPAHAAAITQAMGGLSMSELMQTADLVRSLGLYAADTPAREPRSVQTQAK